MQTLTSLSAEVLRSAVECGVIDDPINEILGGALPNDLVVPASIISNVAGSPALVQNPNQFEPFEHPDSRRYQVSSFGPFTNVDTESYYVAEVARFVVPDGHLGVLKSLEQTLHDSGGAIYPTNQEYWGSPYSVNADINQNRWYLTIDYFDGTQPDPYVALAAGAILIEHLPGMPYPELNTINGLWYPANCPTSFDLSWIVPSQRVLRFFWVCPPTTNYEWTGGGRLTGFTQSAYSNDTMSNARRDY